MSRKQRLSLALGVLLVPLISWTAYALGQDALFQATVDGGGGTSVGNTFTLSGTSGQPDAGRSDSFASGGDLEIRGGFWHGAQPTATGVGDTPVAGRTELKAPFPNPFNPRTEIRFDLAHEAPVRVEVLDARGRRVRTLVDGVRPAGSHQLVWRGRADDGRGVASGVYFVRLIADGRAQTQKMTLVK
ncbi:MAG TPA: FlgD immunoglobulin-like domain containing protein [Candidatus Krumholzibacteria bacterium]|nr:FlgD immunoglobulin-like domain containing protein [Candidatus Krumholzibacteria bacterium]